MFLGGFAMHILIIFQGLLKIMLAYVLIVGAIHALSIYGWMYSSLNLWPEANRLIVLNKAVSAHFTEYGTLPVSIEDLNKKYDIVLPTRTEGGKEFVIDRDRYEVYIRDSWFYRHQRIEGI